MGLISSFFAEQSEGVVAHIHVESRNMGSRLDFEVLVDRYYAALFRFALSLTRKESDARDLTQQTFWLWARKGHQLQDPAKVKSWLFTTLHREFLQSHRRSTRFPHHELEEVPEEIPSVPSTTVNDLDGSIIVEYLGRIDSLFQAPLALFYLEDHSYQEIADVLGIPLGTVKSRIARGIAQLQNAVLERQKGRRS